MDEYGKLRFLVVEKSPLMASILRAFARAENVLIVEVEDDSIEVLSRISEIRPDAVILEAFSEGISGLTTANFIVRSFPEVAIVMLGDAGELDIMNSMGVTEEIFFLNKPFTRENFVEMLRYVRNKNYS